MTATIEIDNNAAERALRVVALGRKNFLFAGADGGGESAAAIYSLVGSAKLNGIDPESYLRNVLSRIADHPITTLRSYSRRTSPQVYSSPTKRRHRRRRGHERSHQQSPRAALHRRDHRTRRNQHRNHSPAEKMHRHSPRGAPQLAMLKRQKGESLGQLLSRLAACGESQNFEFVT
jgi:hypothetical protein